MAWSLTRHKVCSRALLLTCRTSSRMTVCMVNEKRELETSSSCGCLCHSTIAFPQRCSASRQRKLQQQWPGYMSSRKTSTEMWTDRMAEEKAELRTLYPEIEPYNEGWLEVSSIHTLKYWQYGNSSGKPVVFVHGGPGSGTSPRDSRYFDPAAYRIILFDQRGSGQSTPSAELKDNTTWHSVEDMEKLRKHLGVDRWVVFGGSWGSTLSLAYAETHPDRVKALVLRGIFTLRRRELEWFYEDRQGACMIYPDYFEQYRDYIPRAERRDMMGAYYRRLTSDDEKVQLEAAKHWAGWEMATSRLFVDNAYLQRTENDHWAMRFARIECHFFIHGGFLESDTQLLDDVHKIRNIPATIVQGRYDIVCPPDSAWELHKRWPEAEFFFIQDSGHSAVEPGTTSRLVQATDKYKNL